MQQYAINLRDNRVVLCTRETLNNIDYRLISQKTAFAIRDGKASAKSVVEDIKSRLRNSEDWGSIIEKRSSQNIAYSQLTREDVEKAQTSIEDVEGREVFDIGDAADETPEKPKRGRGKKAETPDTEEIPADDAE